MARARRAAIAALVLIVFLGAVTLGATPDRRLAAAAAVPRPLAVVPWPAAPAVVLAEVVTGGGSASDEYVELTNRSSAAVDLAGLELVYVTSSGTTVTRKASWPTTQPLEPGQHLLVANALGTFARSADATYSGGLSASGGALAVRAIGGSAIDAVGWGDATNAFVEGTAAPAPPAGSSIERRPGGSGGNVVDTNDDALDWIVVAAPLAQNLAAPPVPGPGASPIPTPTPAPTPTPIPTPTPTPTPAPSPTPTPTPSPAPTPSPTPTSSPTPTPSPSPIPIAAARALPDGQLAIVEGVVTVGLGTLESGRSGFIQDGTGGIGIYLDAAALVAIPSGTLVRATGVVDDRYAQRTLRLAATQVIALGASPLPDPQTLSTGAASELIEGSRVLIEGTVVESPTSFADGLGLLVNDGSGPLRVIVAPAAIAGLSPVRGDQVSAYGPLGQHDSSGTGTEGYRVLATNPGELFVTFAPAPTPTPAPTDTPGPTPSPTANASATPTPTGTPAPTSTPTTTPAPTGAPSPSPSPTPTATPSSPSIASIRGLAIGASATVQGVLTAEPGRVGGATLVAIGDASGGIFVRIPEGGAAPGRGTLAMISGTLYDPYGQLELRTGVGGIVPIPIGASVPAATTVEAADLGERTEGRLVSMTGTIEHNPTKTGGGGLAAILVDDAGGRARILATGASGILAGNLLTGHRYRLTGIVGQHASHKGALDGYRLWLRDRADIVHLADPSPSPSGGPSPSPTPGGSPTVVSIARALGLGGKTVAVEGVVTIPARLLDATGRRIVIQDATAAIEVRVPSGSAVPKPGRRIRVTGEVGRAYDAPRIRAKTVIDLGAGTLPSPRVLNAGPTVALEWQLVRVAGTVLEVHRLGDRWRAELRVGSARVAIVGLPGAATPKDALVAGRRATIVGVVRRAYPGAADRRFAVAPRSRSDVALGGGNGALNPGSGSAGATQEPGGPVPAADPGTEPGSSTAPKADLSSLADHLGDRVRVGGLVVELAPDGFSLDDGSATGRIVLAGDAAQFLGLIEPGDAVEATGRVEASDEGDGPRLIVERAADLVRAGDLGASPPTAQPGGGPAQLSGAPGDGPAAGGGAREAGLGGLPDPTVAGAGWIALMAGLSLSVTLIRRRRVRRALEARIAARLAVLAGPPGLP